MCFAPRFDNNVHDVSRNYGLKHTWKLIPLSFVSLSLSGCSLVLSWRNSLSMTGKPSTASKFLRARRIVHVRELQFPTPIRRHRGKWLVLARFPAKRSCVQSHYCVGFIGRYTLKSFSTSFFSPPPLAFVLFALHDLRFIGVGICCFLAHTTFLSCYCLLYSRTVFSSFVQIVGILYLVDDFLLRVRASFIFVARDSLDFHTILPLLTILRIFSLICHINRPFAQLAELFF